MNLQSIRIAALVFMILGLTGIVSGTGPLWGRYTTFACGIVLYLVTISKNPKK